MSMQEAIHELELKVLKALRPQLEQWEARTFGSKEAEIGSKLEEIRRQHAQRMYSLRAERSAIMNQLQEEMGSLKGSREFAEMREQHEQDVLAISNRLRALQAYVESAEAELSSLELTSTRARAVLPAAARELASLSLSYSEGGEADQAAALFAHSLAILEAAFGSQQPEIAAFKSEVQQVVDSSSPNKTSGAASDVVADEYYA
ncbi:MAG: hypothetical protein SGPRY_008065 [Prymnesium sp.]